MSRRVRSAALPVGGDTTSAGVARRAFDEVESVVRFSLEDSSMSNRRNGSRLAGTLVSDLIVEPPSTETVPGSDPYRGKELREPL